MKCGKLQVCLLLLWLFCLDLEAQSERLEELRMHRAEVKQKYDDKLYVSFEEDRVYHLIADWLDFQIHQYENGTVGWMPFDENGKMQLRETLIPKPLTFEAFMNWRTGIERDTNVIVQVSLPKDFEQIAILKKDFNGYFQKVDEGQLYPIYSIRTYEKKVRVNIHFSRRLQKMVVYQTATYPINEIKVSAEVGLTYCDVYFKDGNGKLIPPKDLPEGIEFVVAGIIN